MSEVNPYASPRAVEPPIMAASVGDGSGGVWRKGKLLVMDRRAALPNRCVKSNAPADGRLKRSLSWHHPLVFLALLANLLLYVILALILRHTAVIYIGLSQEWFAKRRRAILIAWSLVLLGIVVIVGGIAVGSSLADPNSQGPVVGLSVAIGIFLVLGAAIYGLLAARMVAPTRMTKDLIWLKGVHPDYLASLPEYPGY